MGRKHSLVGKDLAVAEVVSDFGRKYGFGYCGGGLDIGYFDIRQNQVKAVVDLRLVQGGGTRTAKITVYLWKTSLERSADWLAWGEFLVEFEKAYSEYPEGFKNKNAFMVFFDTDARRYEFEFSARKECPKCGEILPRFALPGSYSIHFCKIA